MSYWAIFIAGVFGYVIGRNLSRPEKTLEQEQHEDRVRQLQEDIAYYKKLTRNLVAENTEFRKKINES